MTIQPQSPPSRAPEYELVVAFDHPYAAHFEVVKGKMCIIIPFLNQHEAARAAREIMTSVRPANNEHPVIQGKVEHVSQSE
jgi:hypothetical protein